MGLGELWQWGAGRPQQGQGWWNKQNLSKQQATSQLPPGFNKRFYLLAWRRDSPQICGKVLNFLAHPLLEFLTSACMG